MEHHDLDLAPTDQLTMGRIVRYIDHGGDVYPMIVSKVHGFTGTISGHVFPFTGATRLATAIEHAPAGEARNDTWHWPDGS